MSRTVDGVTYGDIYFDESDNRAHYHCEYCSYSASARSEDALIQRADAHEKECQLNKMDPKF